MSQGFSFCVSDGCCSGGVGVAFSVTMSFGLLVDDVEVESEWIMSVLSIMGSGDLEHVWSFLGC